MTKKIETEQKTIITKEQFQQVSKIYSQVDTITQTNYYFDSKALFLRSKNLSLRIRIFNDTKKAEQTLKIHKDSDGPIDHQLYELTDPLTYAEAEKMIKKRDVIFEDSVGDYLKNNFPTLNTTLQTYSRTVRHLLKGPNDVELTLDETTFPDGYLDYELEIENPDQNVIIETSKILSNQFKMNFKHKSRGKIGRSFQHR